MDDVLVIGGTRFIGRHTVTEFLDHDYDVTLFNRGSHANPFEGDDRVRHVQGDRTDDDALEAAREQIDPDVVIDCVAYHPRDVRVATDVFADAKAYVYVSSGSAYGQERVPKREAETPLSPCTDEQATDDSARTYGNRKAEGDRAVFAAAEDGVRALSVRPTVVYGPYDYTERFDYWLHRVDSYDRVAVPGDGLSLWQFAYVEDVASALRIVAERGEAGEAYNVGDRHAPTLGQWVELIADAMDRNARPVGVSGNELAAGMVAPEDFPLYRDQPHLLSTAKLQALGWESTPHEQALAATVAEHRESDRTGQAEGPDRESIEMVIGSR
ncbi:NAD-dependent epimerase/dehydratase family protein [Halorhabdus sp. CBA1104]|uniref:NAD-dependent epimerase/dehydratase family protein n=1 Tax=Halorhabdus sp. CBA1104 TaxID=1380432 RepID=UPI0012B23397|nr:NAD-dependent epimerase/dehydratase family protein [Halorhabdus sp. CBA1104]QGN06937.1 NAD-dependent epimerase/dehydratase family protein [Halorhabdus sp. CBA1104]